MSRNTAIEEIFSHVKAITKSAFYLLKNIVKLRGLMSKHDLENLINAFIFMMAFQAFYEDSPETSLK